jgi:hypothetical protein
MNLPLNTASYLLAAAPIQRGRLQSITKLKGRERPPVAFRAAGRAKRGGRSRPFDVLARVRSLGTEARTALLNWGVRK